MEGVQHISAAGKNGEEKLQDGSVEEGGRPPGSATGAITPLNNG